MYKLGSLFAIIIVLLVLYPISSHAAATRFGLQMRFTNSEGLDAGMALLEFDPIEFNQWIPMDELKNVSASGVCYESYDTVDGTGSPTTRYRVYDFNKLISFQHGENNFLFISDEEPWYPVSYMTVDDNYPLVWGLRMDEWDRGVSMYWDWEAQTFDLNDLILDVRVTTQVWFDDPVPATVPIPASAILLVSGLLPAAVFRKRFVRT